MLGGYALENRVQITSPHTQSPSEEIHHKWTVSYRSAGKLLENMWKSPTLEKYHPPGKLMKYLYFTLFNLFNLSKYYNIPKVAK